MSIVSILAISGYALAWVTRILSFKPSPSNPTERRSWGCMLTGLTAISLHALALVNDPDSGQSFNFSFFHAVSLILLMINGIVVLTSIFRPVDQPGIITYPLAALALGLAMLVPEPLRTPDQPADGMQLHILSSLFAFSLLAIAAIQALILSVQDNCLRQRVHRGWMLRSLPSLESTENLMFRLLIAGTALLTLSLISGFLFLEDMFAQHLAHKTILALFAWGLLVTLLVGRHVHGWRGIVAIRWTLSAFMTLVLAYFGSKFVLELILRRS